MKYYDNNISDIYKELKSSANGISNSEADNLLIEMDRDIKKNNISKESMCHVHSCTGCNQLKTVIETPIFLGTYRIPKNYMKSILGFYYTNSDFRLPKEMEIQVQLI